MSVAADGSISKRLRPRATGAPGGEPAKQVAIDVLREAGEPLHATEIAKRMLASGRCAGLKGKTPAATISAMLAVGAKPGGPFARVDKGTYTLAANAKSEPTQPQKPPTPKLATPKATRAPARKRQATAATRAKNRPAKRSR